MSEVLGLSLWTNSLVGLPLYALQRVDDRWLVWAPDADPRLPAVRVVAVLNMAEPRMVQEKPSEQRALRRECGCETYFVRPVLPRNS